jgi:hypothetical protein
MATVDIELCRMRCIAPLLWVALALGGCNVCENEVSQTVSSPSGRWKAIVFHRGCGATLGFNTQLSVISSSTAMPEGAGNAFVIDGTVVLKLKWLSDTSLLVSGAQGARIYRREERVGKVSLEYLP